MTALMIAIQFNRVECIPLLKSEIFVVSEGLSALLLACQSKNKVCQSVVFNLLKKEIVVKDSGNEIKKLVNDEEKYKKLAKSKDKNGWTALMYASQQGLTAQVETLSKFELTMQNKDGKTALFIAVQNSRASCVQYLKAEADIITNNNMTPLHQLFDSWTLNNKQIDDQCVYQLLYFEKADQIGKAFELDMNTLNKMIKKQDISQMTALMYAARSGSRKWVELLAPMEIDIKLKSNTNALMIAVQNKNNQCIEPLKSLIGLQTSPDLITALHYACDNGSVECVKCLLSEAKMVDNTGAGGLMLAAKKGHVQCAEIMAKYEIQFKNKARQTALMQELECRDDVSGCVSLLKPEIGKCFSLNNQTELQVAASQGNKKCIFKLLTKEYEVDENGRKVKKFEVDDGALKTQIRHQDNKGNTALMYLAISKIPTWVEVLVKYESEMQNIDGNTALHFAADNGSTECVKLLLSQIRIKNNEGETALLAAASKNSYNCIPHLLALQGEKNKQGRTALHIAAQKDYSQCVMLLQSEMNIRDSEGNTALMIAAQKNHQICVSHLRGELKQRNDKKDGPKSGWTALHFVVENGFIGCVSLLKEEKDIKNDQGQTPLQLAKQIGSSAQLMAELE